MDNDEATQILAEHMQRLRGLSYAELKRWIDEKVSETKEVTGSSGTQYQLEFEAMWDDRAHGNIRVMGSIDDGGWRAIVPLTDSFIMAPD